MNEVLKLQYFLTYVSTLMTDIASYSYFVRALGYPLTWSENRGSKWHGGEILQFYKSLRICPGDSRLLQSQRHFGVFSFVSRVIYFAALDRWPVHCYTFRSADDRTLLISRTRTNFGDRAFSAARPRVCNHLLTDLRQPGLS